MLDYLHWRGDLSFARVPFCEVDALIFAWIAYYPFELLEARGISIEGKSLQQLAQLHLAEFGEFRQVDPRKKPFPTQNAQLLFSEAAATDRFCNVVIDRFQAVHRPEEGTQFAAISMQVEGVRLIAYRGTDSTVAGWKEDCRLAFCESVPAQQLADAFLQACDDGRELVLCGHSKGGNLAMYAALCVPEATLPRLKYVYNFDGPGFCFDLLKLERYERLRETIITIVPEASIIGMLLEHEEDYIVIESDMAGILQHNGFCWHIERDHFVRAQGRSASSIAIDQTLRDWLHKLSRQEREEFVNLIFSVIEKTGMQDFTELTSDVARRGTRILREMVGLPNSQKRMAFRLFAELLRQGGSTVSSMWREGEVRGRKALKEADKPEEE